MARGTESWSFNKEGGKEWHSSVSLCRSAELVLSTQKPLNGCFANDAQTCKGARPSLHLCEQES